MAVKITSALFGAAIVAALGQGGSALAGVFTSSAAFSSATTGLAVEDYGSYTAGTLIPDGSTLGSLTYSFSTASGLGGVVTDLYNSFSGNSLAAKQVAGPLSNVDYFYTDEGFTVTFPTAVTAVGIFSNTNLPVAADLTTSSGSTGSITFSSYDTNTFVFLGFTSSTPFTSATFVSTTFNVPEIEYGSAVPEPSTWAMMLLGFAGLGFAGYRTS
jgi:hypothetical protein